jgi:hypothetical protein
MTGYWFDVMSWKVLSAVGIVNDVPDSRRSFSVIELGLTAGYLSTDAITKNL